MIKVIMFQNEKKYLDDFLRFSQKLYSRKKITEDWKTVKSLLLENHPLNKYFALYKFIAYRDNKVVGRCALTIYPGDDTAYLGFYECINDAEIARELFRFVNDFCKEKKCAKIVGPVDCSFWIKYRMKINMFEQLPYTSEPYNKEYYFQQWQENGYEICEHYVSNVYLPIKKDFTNKKLESAFQKFKQKGYRIVIPNLNDFSRLLHEIYILIMKLYRDFPIFKEISEEDFVKIFHPLKKIINMNMVRMVYYQNMPVAFCIAVPNYYGLVSNITLSNALKIMNIKKKPKEYVMLYVGVLEEHLGLGNAMMKEIVDELKKNETTCIGALIRDGKFTNNYVKELKKGKYEYVILQKKII